MTTTLAANFIVRAPTLDDAQGILSLINASDVSVIGQVDSDINTVLDDWKRLSVDIDKDARIIMAPDETVIGYEIIYSATDDGVITTDGYVHPQYNGRGVGTRLLRWSETRAREMMSRYLPDIRVTLMAGTFTGHAETEALFLAEGYHTVRYFWRMTIDMDQPTPAPEWPAGIAVRTFVRGEDEQATYDSEVEAFRDHWNPSRDPFEEWVETRIHSDYFDPSLWFLAMDGDQIAGLARCRFRMGHGWIMSLAVRRPWRRRGLAMALLRHSFGEFYHRGERQVSLGVDSQNPTGATRLYERAGMHITQRYTVFEKELRAAEPR